MSSNHDKKGRPHGLNVADGVNSNADNDTIINRLWKERTVIRWIMCCSTRRATHGVHTSDKLAALGATSSSHGGAGQAGREHSEH